MLLETALVLIVVAVTLTVWGQWWFGEIKGDFLLRTMDESEEQWRRCLVRLTRELHDAGAASGGGTTLGWRDGSGRWVTVSLNSNGQLIQAVNGAGAVVLGNGLKSVDFVVEQGGVTVRAWSIKPWTEEPITAFVAFRLPPGKK